MVKMPLLRSFLRSFSTHSGQQAEIVLLDCFLPTANLEFAFGTMPVQDKIGWGRVGQQCGNFIQSLPHFAGQGRGFHLQCGMVVAMNDFAEADSASEYFGEHKRIKRQQQFFVFAELVGEHKAGGDEMGGLAPAFWRDTLNRMETCFEILGCRNNVESQPPLGCFEVFLGRA